MTEPQQNHNPAPLEVKSNSIENIKPLSTSEEKKSQKPMGPLVGIIIIIIVLALGGFYFWGQRLVKSGILNEEERDKAIDAFRNLPASDPVKVVE